jgi:diguanylate cyclase (GGDEF)-like protein/PAS domain S-box-containing protein
MALRTRLSRQRQNLQGRLALIVTFAVFALLGADAISLAGSREQTLRDAEAETANLSRSLADQAHRIFQLMDADLLGARAAIETADFINPAAEQRMQRMMAARAADKPSTYRLVILDLSGRVLVESRGDLKRGVDFSGFELFAHHRDNPSREAFIGRPLRDPGDGTWVVTVSRRFDAADGRFAGVVVAEVPVAFFQKLYASFNNGRDGVILLARSDAVLMARWPGRMADVGSDLSASPLFKQFVGPGDRQNFEFVSLLDGRNRLASYTWVDDSPTLVMVGRGKDAVLDNWRMAVWGNLLGLAVVLGMLLLLARRLAQKIAEEAAAQEQLISTNLQLARSEASTARAVQWLKLAEQIAQVGHWYLDATDGNALTWSDEVYRIYGVEKETFTPSPELALAFYMAEDGQAAAEALSNCIASGQPYEKFGRIVRPDGAVRHVFTRGEPQQDQAGRVVAVFGVVMDVTVQKQAEADLRRATAQAEAANRALEAANAALETLAMQDSLTTLPNRRQFDRALDQEFRRAVRGHSSLALIMIDVDQFKPFNDMYGHQAGDACLRAIAQTLPSLLQRPGDIAARYGGEELAVLLPGNTKAGARDLALRIAVAVRELGIVHAGSLYGVVTISAGVEVFAPVHEADRPADLVERADAALYAAKRSGRDRVVCYSDLGLAGSASAELSSADD